MSLLHLRHGSFGRATYTQWEVEDLEGVQECLVSGQGRTLKILKGIANLNFGAYRRGLGAEMRFTDQLV